MNYTDELLIKELNIHPDVLDTVKRAEEEKIL